MRAPLPLTAPETGNERSLVLLAEDDDELRKFLAWRFRRLDLDVAEVRDGSELLSYIGKSLHFSSGVRVPNVLVSDIRMPGLDGMSVLATLRSNDWATPVVVITAFGNPETHDEALRLGAAAVLDKPFDVDELCRIVVGLADASSG